MKERLNERENKEKKEKIDEIRFRNIGCRTELIDESSIADRKLS